MNSKWKWVKALSIEQAALMVMGFDPERCIVDIQGELDEFGEVENLRISSIPEDDREEGIYQEWLDESEGIRIALVSELSLIYAAIEDSESVFTQATLQPHVLSTTPDLTVEGVFRTIDYTIFTKQSIAQWLFESGDVEKARILVPNFRLKASEDSSQLNDLIEKNKVLSDDCEVMKKELNKKTQLGDRETSKPFDLIRQLIKIIEPEANFQKYSQLHSLLNGKLAGDDELVVSRNTFKTYLEK